MTPQRAPKPDNRYRVHRSVKCYLAELACGTHSCTWYLHDSIERVVHLFPGGIEKIQYKRKFHTLQSPVRLKELVAEQLLLGGAVHLGGQYITGHEADRAFEPYPFIDVSSCEDRERYEQLIAKNRTKE